jgi:hypothetical protein
MATPHADLAATATAGFKNTTTDRGAAFSPASERWHVHLTKPLVGYPGATATEIRADGYGASQGAAETAAVAALNKQRQIRYGHGSANTGVGPAGGSMTDDLS